VTRLLDSEEIGVPLYKKSAGGAPCPRKLTHPLVSFRFDNSIHAENRASAQHEGSIMSPRSCPTVADYRRQATLLLKDLRSSDPPRQEAASRRLAILPLSASKGVIRQEEAQRKHALQVIALEQGAPDWAALKAHTEPIETAELLYANGQMAAFWNIWFARYEEAQTVHREKGGFLFPYRNNFFVCDEHFVRAAGLDPDAPEWLAIGHDWARPADRKAWVRLAAILRKNAAGLERQRAATPA
jgi:hypothetical protein